MEAILRPAEIGDYNAIASWVDDAEACARWAGPAVPFPFLAEELPDILSVTGGKSYCLAGSDGECIGFGQFWTVTQGAVHIGRIIISPSARGSGAGRVLCEKLIDRALRSTDSSVVTLRVYRTNSAALSLYSGLGFTVVEMESTSELLFMKAEASSLRERGI